MELFNNLFIFEMANNHQGDVAHGISIIKEMGLMARKHKINAAVKLQYRQLDTFIHPDYRSDKDAKHIGRFLSTELNANQFLQLVEQIKKEGMICVCTPFDEASVDVIVEHGIDAIKVASCSADDWPLLSKIASVNKPVIASTGGLDIKAIDNLVSFLKHKERDFAILHCVGIYPSPNEVLNLQFISKLKKRYPDLVIGYSGHEAPDNYDVAKVAVSLGAKIFERHIGLPTEKITLNGYSMNPAQADSWIESVLITQSILGSALKSISNVEIDSLTSLKRGVFAKHEIKNGELIGPNNVFFAMPCQPDQLTSGEFGRVRASYTASKNYKLNEPIHETYEKDTYYSIREIIHDAKGMMSEAGITLNEDAEIELSHHYGLEKFREVGCLIVNLVNREYCKKIIVVFPGQYHPEQYHVKKEETFHILQGEMLVKLNGIEHTAKQGEIIVIERGVKHAFGSENGAIIEEVSTTHYRNDSFYTDPKISEQDPMQRKTVIDIW